MFSEYCSIGKNAREWMEWIGRKVISENRQAKCIFREDNNNGIVTIRYCEFKMILDSTAELNFAMLCTIATPERHYRTISFPFVFNNSK